MKTSKFIISIIMIAIMICVALLMINLNINMVKAYNLCEFDLVDSGKHMDWTGSTKYSSEWSVGVDVWNNEHNVIRQDTWKTVLDVTISDFTDTGYLVSSVTSSGTIRFNTYYIDNYSASEKSSVVIQSIGLALGIAWNDDPSSVMYGEYGSTILNQDDIAAFNWLYNYQY